MVAVDAVHASNAQLRELGPGLVALFVGGTSGIGEYTLKAFVEHAVAPRVYLVGRNTTAAERIISECGQLNQDATVEFLKADVSELAEVDRVCREVKRKEKKVNLLVQSQGNMNFRGRDESPEGIDRKMSLNYYSRMRFISNFLPLLQTASTNTPNFSRSLSILSPGAESRINLDDLELKNAFSIAKCAGHTIVMNDFMVEEYTARQPETSFIHSYPSAVNTGVLRELPAWARLAVKAFLPLISPFMVSAGETGERQLFHATSGLYPPAKPIGGVELASGVPAPKAIEIATGANGQAASGGYLVNWNGEVTKQKKLLLDYRKDGYAKIIWEHTMQIFERIDKINQGRIDVASS